MLTSRQLILKKLGRRRKRSGAEISENISNLMLNFWPGNRKINDIKTAGLFRGARYLLSGSSFQL
jgi:hypothetical protein